MGIQRWACIRPNMRKRMWESPTGQYVLFIDHEQVVAEMNRHWDATHRAAFALQRAVDLLRAELAAKSKDAEALADKSLTYLTGAYHDPEVEPADAYRRRRVLEANRLNQAIDVIRRDLE